MRLDKYLSNATDLSRAEVKRLIRKGLVAIDGEPVTSPAFAVAEHAEVELDGSVIATPGHRYFMLHKPTGYVSATKDSEHPTVLDLIFESRSEQLQIVGRLDIDASGLLLITDDGQWNHRITSPRHQCEKIYLAEVAEPLGDELVAKFAEGVWLDGEKRRTEPALLEILSKHSARLTITEGRYHQVKRMFAAAGNRVTALHRERIGHIELDPALEPGDYRPLTAEEIKLDQNHA